MGMLPWAGAAQCIVARGSFLLAWVQRRIQLDYQIFLSIVPIANPAICQPQPPPTSQLVLVMSAKYLGRWPIANEAPNW